MAKIKIIWLTCKNKKCGWEGYNHQLKQGCCPDCGGFDFRKTTLTEDV